MEGEAGAGNKVATFRSHSFFIRYHYSHLLFHASTNLTAAICLCVFVWRREREYTFLMCLMKERLIP